MKIGSIVRPRYYNGYNSAYRSIPFVVVDRPTGPQNKVRIKPFGDLMRDQIEAEADLIILTKSNKEWCHPNYQHLLRD